MIRLSRRFSCRRFFFWPLFFFPISFLHFLFFVWLTRPRDERVGSKGMTKDGINDTASTLFAEVKAIFSKAKKQRPAGGGG